MVKYVGRNKETEILDAISMLIVFFLLYWGLSRLPDKEKVLYWDNIIKEGQNFMTALKEDKVTFIEFSKWSDSKQDTLIRKLGYVPEDVDAFVELAAEFPEEKLMTVRHSQMYREYRVTRQAIRRFPGAGSFKVGPF